MARSLLAAPGAVAVISGALPTYAGSAGLRTQDALAPTVPKAVRSSGSGVKLLRVSDVRPRLGDSIAFSGVLRDPGWTVVRTVALQWRSKRGEWSTVARVGVGVSGAFAFQYQVRTSSVRWYRVRVEGWGASRRGVTTKTTSRPVKVAPRKPAAEPPRVPAARRSGQQGTGRRVGAPGAPVVPRTDP